MYDQELLKWASATLSRVNKNPGGNQVFNLPSGAPPPAQLADFVYGGITLRHNGIFVAHWYSRPRKALRLLTRGKDWLILCADEAAFRSAMDALRNDQLWSGSAEPRRNPRGRS